MDANDYLSGRLDRKQNNILAMLEVHSKRYQTAFDYIITLSELRDKQADKITTILSDYTEIVNQVSVVATLTLGSAVGLYSVLVGSESYFHPEWKHALLCISSVVTVCFSITSVIESFFLGVRIDQIEARFVAGVYPHLDFSENNARQFNENDLQDINAVFNFILITFFASFVSFAFGLLGVAYIGMGRSNSIWVLDERSVTSDFNGNIFMTNITGQTVSDLEPGYLSSVWVVNIIVLITYAFIFWRFFGSHSMRINANSLLRFTFLCGCADIEKKRVKSSMFTPIEYAAVSFNDLQRKITKATKRLQRKEKSIIKKIRNVTKTKERSVSSEEREFYVKLKETIDKMISPGFASLDSDEIVASPIQARENMMSGIVLISELEEFYDDFAFGGKTFDLVNASIMGVIEQFKTKLKILEEFLDAEKPKSVEWQTLEIGPYGKTLNFFLVLWGITGGFAITVLLFGISVLIYFPWAALETCFNGHASRNVCDFVSDITTMHIRWLTIQQKELVKVTTKKTNRNSNMSKWKGKTRTRYYDSFSLKL